MSGNSPSINPLGYAGVLPNFPPNQIRNNRPPLSTDINANIGDEWEDASVTPSNFYKLANLYSNVATWILIGAGSGELISLSDTANTVVTPTSFLNIPPNNIQLINLDGGLSVTSDPSNHRIIFGLTGGSEAVDSIAVQTGTSPIVPTAAGLVTINGATVAAGTNPVRSDGTGANTLAIEVQLSQAIAAQDATKVGLSAFDSGSFSVDANGFVTLKGGSQAIDTLVPNSGINVVPNAAGEINSVGTGSITTIGTLNTLTTQLTGLTNHNILVGAGTTTIGLIIPSTAGFVLTSNGASSDPTFQAVSASGAITSITGDTGGTEVPLLGNFNILGTGSITVVGSANTETVQLTGLTNNAIQVGAGTTTLTQLGPANRSVLTTNSTGVPTLTSLANGQLIIGSTAGDPAAATLTAGSGISIANGSNSIIISASASGMSWQVIGASQTLVANNGYFCTTGGALALLLPATSTVGDTIDIVLDGSTSWTITQPNAGTQIRFGNTQTTIGVGGTLASTAQGDSIELICETVNGRWAVVRSIGNITVV